MSKKNAKNSPDTEQLPSQFDKQEAADTDARLHGDDSLPAEAPVVDGTEPDEASQPALPNVSGHAQAVAQTRSFHGGVEDALRRYAHNVDGTEYIGTKGITLAEALEANDQKLKAALRGLGA